MNKCAPAIIVMEKNKVHTTIYMLSFLSQCMTFPIIIPLIILFFFSDHLPLSKEKLIEVQPYFPDSCMLSVHGRKLPPSTYLPQHILNQFMSV